MQVTLKQEEQELTFVLEVYVRRNRKEGTRKQEQADTRRSATEDQGTVLLLGQGGVRLWPILGLWFPSASNKQTKPLGKRGLFWTQGDKGLTQTRKKKSKRFLLDTKYFL